MEIDRLKVHTEFDFEAILVLNWVKAKTSRNFKERMYSENQLVFAQNVPQEALPRDYRIVSQFQ